MMESTGYLRVVHSYDKQMTEITYLYE